MIVEIAVPAIIVLTTHYWKSCHPPTPTRESLFSHKFALNFIFNYDASMLHLNCNPNLNPSLNLNLNLNPKLNLNLNLN